MELSSQNAIPSQEIDQFRQRCLSFLIEAAVQIMKRFPFREAMYKNLEVLVSEVVKSKKVTSLAPLILSFPTLVSSDTVQAIDTEWRLLKNTDLETPAGVSPIQF